MNRIIRIIALLMVITQLAFGQGNNTGSIYGRVIDEKGLPLDFASVVALQGDIIKGGKKTNEQGNYEIKPLAPGKYTIKVTFSGYQAQEIQGVVVNAEGRPKIDVKMEKSEKQLKEVKVTIYRVPVIDPQGAHRSIDKEDIKHMSSVSTGDFATMTAGAYQKNKGSSDVNLGGDRSTGTAYMIDGILVRGTRATNLPTGSIDNLEVIQNGVPAKYGNATGGIITITTKGIEKKLSGGIQAQHSIEGFNNNLVAANLSGPLLSIKKNGVKRPVIGFGINGQVKFDKDNSPSFNKYYKVNDDKMVSLNETPIIPDPRGSNSFVRTSEYITNADMHKIKARQDGQNFAIDYVGKLDFQPVENMNITIGTTFNYSKYHSYNYGANLFAVGSNVLAKEYTGRGYARFTHRLGKEASKEKKDEKKSSISNAYYTIQFTYQKEYSDYTNPLHGHNIFDYNYVGKFTSHRSAVYQLDTALNLLFQAQKLKGFFNDSVSFIPSNVNPNLANYTKSLYNNIARFPVQSTADIAGYGALRNGDNPLDAYQLWDSPGSQTGFMQRRETDQATLNLDASFSVEQGSKHKTSKDPIIHNIEFGLGYDQKTQRGYDLGNLQASNNTSMWSLMRLLANRHIQNLDMKHPQFWIGGVQYDSAQIASGVVSLSPFDTIKYNQLYDANSQARFDKSLRQKLFGNGTEATNLSFIDVDNLDPSTFTLDMFSASDLLNSGKSNVNYYGYDYLGNKVKKQPSFNDFWSKKDSRGDLARPIGAFRPIYMYGYLLDKFTYKDISFNIGVRVDRYDANQKVLKDPYSLYAVRKVGDVKSGTYTLPIDKTNDNAQAPDITNFDKNYVVYVNNSKATKPTVVGYRKGDTWYDPFGKEISDPTVLSGLYADGLPIQPWLQNPNDSIKSTTFNASNSFQDYKPRIAVSPRIKFAFPISDEALFYGNYDVISQVPGATQSIVTPDDYYYLAERQQTINNANMTFEKAINYSIGYQQKLSPKASITLEAYYRERKNQIQLQRYTLAYPITYQSYGNRDFSSTKGFSAHLDFRRQGPIKMDLNYTLQFAEGTGSSTTSQNSLLATGQPNLRSVFPLNYDSRHLIAARIDYRYDDKNKGPKVGNKYPFSNAGVNFNLTARSGEPYTKSSVATPLVGGDFQSLPIVGTMNGSRLPWNWEVGMRIDKNFQLTPKSKKDKEGNIIKTKSPLYINVYTYVSNLFNTRNTLNVYRYTGSGADDGYIASPQGQSAINSNYLSSQSFTDLYRYRLLNPGNFNLPRMITVGFSLDF